MCGSSAPSDGDAQGGQAACGVGPADPTGSEVDLKGLGRLNLLETVTPEGIRSVMDGYWEEVIFAVDSGASETVAPEDCIMSAETKEGMASRRGVQYEVANGVKIPNLGEKRFVG